MGSHLFLWGEAHPLTSSSSNQTYPNLWLTQTTSKLWLSHIFRISETHLISPMTFTNTIASYLTRHMLPKQQRKLRRLLLLHSNRLIVLIPIACQYKFGMVSTFKWLDLGTSLIRPIVGPCDSRIWHLQSEMPPKKNIVWDGNGPKAFPKMFYPWNKYQIPFRLLSFILIIRRLHLFSKHFPLVHWSNQNLPREDVQQVHPP